MLIVYKLDFPFENPAPISLLLSLIGVESINAKEERLTLGGLACSELVCTSYHQKYSIFP